MQEGTMNNRSIIRNVSLIIVFCAVGIVLFTENVRLVQIIGLFACGMVIGVSLDQIIQTLRKKNSPDSAGNKNIPD
jgi:predicted metal-binding protein